VKKAYFILANHARTPSVQVKNNISLMNNIGSSPKVFSDAHFYTTESTFTTCLVHLVTHAMSGRSARR